MLSLNAPRLPRWHVLYHYPCPDGAFAIWGIEMARRQQIVQVDITYQAHSTSVDARLDVNELPRADKLVLVDYVGPNMEWVLQCCARYPSVMIIDHHKTAANMLAQMCTSSSTVGGRRTHQGPANLVVHFDENSAASSLVCRVMEVQRTERQNLLFALVQDHDLYTHLHPHSMEFSDALFARRIQYDIGKNPALFEQLDALNADELFAEGMEIKKRNDRLVQRYLESAVIKQFGESIVLCVLIQEDDAGIVSQLGHELAKLSPHRMGAACIMQEAAGFVKVSIRSVAPVDCSVVAQAYGGGGHGQAAGFCVPLDQWHKSMKL